MSEERWLRLNLLSMREFYARFVANVPEARLIVEDGLIAVVNPAAERNSLFNSVIYEDPAAVEHHLADLAGTYEDAGVLAWTVWVAPGDTATARLLESAGHLLDSVPRMMGTELAELDLSSHSMEGIEWTAEGDGEDVARINDIAYGLPPGVFGRGVGEISLGDYGIYVADYEGGPGSCLITMDHGSDVGIWAVATLPEARNRKLAQKLTLQALADARERGIETSTLQSSALGRPVYERIGYNDFGNFEMWERRREG